jgi:hypothetical protein
MRERSSVAKTLKSSLGWAVFFYGIDFLLLRQSVKEAVIGSVIAFGASAAAHIYGVRVAKENPSDPQPEQVR